MIHRTAIFLTIAHVMIYGQIRAVSPVYPPLVNSVDGSTVTDGLAVEIVREAAKRAKISLKFEIEPFARAMASAQNNKNVLVYPVIRSTERDVHFEWLGPVNRVRYFLYGLKTQALAPLDSIGDAREKRIAIINRDIIDSYFANKNFKNIHRVNSVESMIAMLLHKRVDYIVITPESLAAELAKNSLGTNSIVKVIAVRSESTDHQSYLAIRKDSDARLKDKMKNAIISMIKDGTWDKIYNKYTKQTNGPAPL